MKSSSHPDELIDPPSPVAAQRPPPRLPDALLIDVGPAHADLIAHWLDGIGWPLRQPAADGGAAPVRLIVMEIAFPRESDRQRLDALAARWPSAPVVVLSPTFRGEVPPHGACARQLGAAAVLATPLARERFVAAVRELGGGP